MDAYLPVLAATSVEFLTAPVASSDSELGDRDVLDCFWDASELSEADEALAVSVLDDVFADSAPSCAVPVDVDAEEDKRLDIAWLISALVLPLSAFKSSVRLMVAEEERNRSMSCLLAPSPAPLALLLPPDC